MAPTLSTTDHRSDIVGMRYIYPVLSRRAGGLSIGINFNTNNTCNWRCIYCQVPDLQRGVAPALDFGLLEEELKAFFSRVLHGDFFESFNVIPEQRVIKDIAIAGNGEPTTLKELPEAIALIGKIATAMGILPNAAFILITNGSLIHQPHVQQALTQLSHYNGQVWFKFDSATEAGRKLINNTGQSLSAAVENLILATKLCPTLLQICLIDYAGNGFSNTEHQAFVALLQAIKQRCDLQTIMVYSLARTSQQPEAALIKPMPSSVLNAFAEDIRKLNFIVSVSQ
ncbi:MAG: radical SAM protein [Methylococcaceae bacterium]|nr:MAG: radical SAM protein [Methylococcaceae bacterium]